MKNINTIKGFHMEFRRLDKTPGRIVFAANYRRVANYIVKYIKKYYGKRAAVGAINDVFGYFTEDNKKWFKVVLVNKTTPAEIAEWNEVWIDKTLKKEIIKDRILPKAKGKYKIHWI